MRKFVVVFFCLTLTALSAQTATAESKWTPIADNDYIFGYTSYKYSCWSGVTKDNLPTIEIYSNNTWVTVVTGEILPAGSDIKTPCEAAFPIAVGFIWTVMAPSPPSYQTNRYSALYRQKIPDREIITQKLVTTQVYEDQEKCCTTKTVSKRVPYIAKVKKDGKYVNVIKYKTVKSQVSVTYTESVLVDKDEWRDEVSTVKGWTGQSANIYIYPSVSAMNQEYADLASGVLCAFGFSSSCKK